jgi:lipoprotein-releasing system permease protein
VGDKLTLISPNGPTTILGVTPLLRSYRIVAVFNVGMSEYDASVIYMPFTEAQDYFQTDNAASAIEIMVAKPDEVDSYIGPLNAAARGHLQFVTWKTTNQTFFNALEVESNVMFLILTLIILVAALNIVSGLIMLVKDKGHDIAILRTMGATSGSVLRIFFMTGAAIGTLGTIAGVLLGVVICHNIEEIRQFLSALTQRQLFSPELYYLSHLPADMDLHQTVAIALMSLGLSFLATLYPSWRAARLDPVEALRYE